MGLEGGREVGGEGEGSGVKGGGKWGLGTPLSDPSFRVLRRKPSDTKMQYMQTVLCHHVLEQVM